METEILSDEELADLTGYKARGWQRAVTPRSTARPMWLSRSMTASTSLGA